MKVEIVQTNNITSFIGVRASGIMPELEDVIKLAFTELVKRQDEIKHIKNPNVTYGISPPNYKGNNGTVDFYCCYEVEPLVNLPHGMVHIHLLPRTYSVTHYTGMTNKKVDAYDYTSQWLDENGYTFDDVAYYVEKYEKKKLVASDDEHNKIVIYCPIKKKS